MARPFSRNGNLQTGDRPPPLADQPCNETLRDLSTIYPNTLRIGNIRSVSALLSDCYNSSAFPHARILPSPPLMFPFRSFPLNPLVLPSKRRILGDIILNYWSWNSRVVRQPLAGNILVPRGRVRAGGCICALPDYSESRPFRAWRPMREANPGLRFADDPGLTSVGPSGRQGRTREDVLHRGPIPAIIR